MGNLLAAADGIQTGEVELTRQLSAQRAGRCMQLLQDMIKACKVIASLMVMPQQKATACFRRSSLLQEHCSYSDEVWPVHS